MRLACLLMVLVAGCGPLIVPNDDGAKPGPVKDDAASVIKSYSAGCADSFDAAALELDAGKDLPTVHDDLRDKLKAVRLSVWKPVDKRLETVGGGEDPDLKEVAKLLRQIATEFRSVK